MISLRLRLRNIGVALDSSFYYKSLHFPPHSLREAMDLMDAPTTWQETHGNKGEDQNWTEECQGVATDGEYWIFSSNGSTGAGSNPRALYFFPYGIKLTDDNIKRMINLDSLFPELHHIGPVSYHDNHLYVSHWKESQPSDQALIFVRTSSGYAVDRVVDIKPVTSDTGETFTPEFQAYDPISGLLATMRGRYDDWQYKVFFHDATSGEWRHTINLSTWVKEIAGVCFSARNIFVACNFRDSAWGHDYKGIYYFSRLNGARMGAIPVLAEESNQEMEGICYAPGPAQIHAVLLENQKLAKDNIFFKQFAADHPDVV